MNHSKHCDNQENPIEPVDRIYILPATQTATSSYIYVYNNGITQNINSYSGTTGTLVIFNTNPIKTSNISFNGIDTITIGVAGTYNAIFTVNASTLDPYGILSFKLLKNSITIPGSIFSSTSSPYTVPYNPTVPQEVVGRVKFSASVGDTIQLATNNSYIDIINALNSPLGNYGTTNSTIAGGSTGAIISSNGINIGSRSSVYAIITTTNNDGTTGSAVRVTAVTDSNNHNYNLVTQVASVVSGGGTNLTQIWNLDGLYQQSNYVVNFQINNSTLFTQFAWIRLFNILSTATPSLDSVSNAIINSTANPLTNTITSTSPNDFAITTALANTTATFASVYPDVGLDQSQFFLDSYHILGTPQTYNLNTYNLNNNIASTVSIAIKTVTNTSVRETPVFASLDLQLL